MIPASLVQSFFSTLSHRFYKENDLSDITWVMCESSSTFKNLFAKYFFKELSDVSLVPFHREYADMGSRPDFFFQLGEQKYIIEVKKYDRNYHFDQYKTDFPGVRFGWISNYKMEEQSEIEIRNWEGFKMHLEISSKASAEKDLILPYISYIERVCSIIQFKKMHLDNSLFFFNKLIEKIILNSLSEYEASLYKQAKNIDVYRNGCYFLLKKGNISIYPWFGIYYDEHRTCIYVGFSSNWCKMVYDAVDPANEKEGEYFAQPERERDSDYNELCYEMKKDHFDKFNDLDISEQERILTCFLREVIKSIDKYIV